MEAKIRRERETLFLSSLAVIIFGVWGSTKVLISYLIDPETWIRLVSDSSEPALTETHVAVLLVLFFLLDIGIRLGIGLPGIKESRANAPGKKVIYLILAVVYLVIDILAYRSTFAATLKEINLDYILENGGIMDPFAMIIIEGTSCFAIVQMILSSLQLKYLRHAAMTT